MSQSLSQHNTQREKDSWIKQELEYARRSLNDGRVLHNNGGSQQG